MLRKITNTVGLIATVAATIGLNSSANAALSATAEFGLVGNTLTITLRNTSPDDVLNPGDVLTGLFLNISGNTVLTPVSAILAPGSEVHFGPNVQNVGGEWAYASGLNVAGFNQGISSAGLGIFGAGNFNGPNLDGPVAVNGGGYGLTSVGDNLAIGNAKVTGGEPLIQSGVVFALTAPEGFSLSQITGYGFQYGTDLNVVPEPSTVIAGALLLLPFAASTLRIVRKNRKA